MHDQATAVLHGKATRVAAGLRRAATRRGLDPPKRAGVDACATYLINKEPYLDYPTALHKGWPIATGVIEGACRHLVKDRMDITDGIESGRSVTSKITSILTAELTSRRPLECTSEELYRALCRCG